LDFEELGDSHVDHALLAHDADLEQAILDGFVEIIDLTEQSVGLADLVRRLLKTALT
jgi:hypothetical protein